MAAVNTIAVIGAIGMFALLIGVVLSLIWRSAFIKRVQLQYRHDDKYKKLAAKAEESQVRVAENRATVTSFEVESETGRDVRRELSAAIVNRGWGLLELRPMRMSLEEIFLHLTTEDTATASLEPPAGGAQ